MKSQYITNVCYMSYNTKTYLYDLSNFREFTILPLLGNKVGSKSGGALAARCGRRIAADYELIMRDFRVGRIYDKDKKCIMPFIDGHMRRPKCVGRNAADNTPNINVKLI